tara:strand:+ start:118 stop:876 length:759 start_codon:yes stop_codon:yes gene_type:complete
MFDLLTVLAILATFFVAGVVKGVIGLGLPSISLALLTVVINLPTSMALLIMPSLVTNIWQAIRGGKFLKILKRLWLLFLTSTLTVWTGSKALAIVDLTLLSALLGSLLMSYAIVSLYGLRFNIKSRNEWWVGSLTGSVNGILTGMTGSFVVPGVFYLQSIRQEKDELIQSMGILFTTSTLALFFSLQTNEYLTSKLIVWSSISIVPSIIGVLIGQQIREWLSEKIFKNVFFFSLLFIGAYIIVIAFKNIFNN